MSVALAATVAAGWAYATHYVYDANGRLSVATNDSGESARYHYDELGNLTQIERIAADTLAIFGFSPSRGAVGVAVRVQGHGFSSVAAENAVQFDGVAASVTSASPSELTAIVPTGASTGPISVTVGSQTASSSAPFIIDDSTRPPLISNVSPTIATEGDVVTVDGSSFEPLANQTGLRLSQRTVLPTTLTNTQTIFNIPPATGSGRVTITTAYGSDSSEQDVLVLPSGTSPGEIEQISRLGIDTFNEEFSVSTTGHYAAALFDASAGEYLSAQFSSVGVSSIGYTLYGTNNATIASGTISSTNPTIHFPRLHNPGTYLLLLKPVVGPATWHMAIERDKLVVRGADALESATTVPGQTLRFLFNATTNQSLGVGVSDLTVSGGHHIRVIAYTSDGTQLASTFCYLSNDGCDFNLTSASTGMHSVVVQPYSYAETMSFKATVSDDKPGVLVRDTTHVLTLGRRGQNGRLKFYADSGETLALHVAQEATVPTDRTVYYTVLKPDGTILTSGTGTLNLPSLPVTGDYSVFVDPRYGAEMNAQLLVATGVTGSIGVDGAIGSYTTPLSGQGVYLSFLAEAGQNIGLGLFDLIPDVGDYFYVDVTVLNPDGTELVSNTSCGAHQGGCDLNLTALAAGNHIIAIEPTGESGSFSVKVALTSDATGTLTRDVTETTALGRRGQNGRYSFEGAAGEALALQVLGDRTGPLEDKRLMDYSIYKPDGTLLVRMDLQAAALANLSSLPQTGEYTLFVDPMYGATADVQVILTSGIQEEADGLGGTYTTQVPGQRVYLTYAINAGQKLGLGIYDLMVSGGSIWMIDHTGSTQCYASNQGCDRNLQMSQAGTYVVELGPPSTATMSFKTALSTDMEGVLHRNFVQPVSLTRRGQNARFTFSATAGESLSLQVVSHSTSPNWQLGVNCTIYRPGGQFWRSTWLHPGLTMGLSNIPSTGTYVVFLDPAYGQTIASEFRLNSPIP